MSPHAWRTLCEEARQQLWPSLSPETQRKLQAEFGPDPWVIDSSPDRSGWQGVLFMFAFGAAVLAALIGILVWWAEVSQRRINDKANEGAIHLERMSKQPGYTEGRQLGYDMGLKGAGAPKSDALVQVGRIHARTAGRTGDDRWVEIFGKGYIDGLIHGLQDREAKAERDRDRWVERK